MKPTNPSTDNNTPAKTIPTNNEVLDVLSFKLSFVWTSFSGFVVLVFLVVADVDDMDVLVVSTVFFVVDLVVVVDGAKVTVVEFFFKLFKSSTCTLASVTTSTPSKKIKRLLGYFFTMKIRKKYMTTAFKRQFKNYTKKLPGFIPLRPLT